LAVKVDNVSKIELPSIMPVVGANRGAAFEFARSMWIVNPFGNHRIGNGAGIDVLQIVSGRMEWAVGLNVADMCVERLIGWGVVNEVECVTRDPVGL
jgi:hypothetical protein